MPLGGPRGSKVWNLSGIQFKSLSTTCLPTFSFLSPIMLILWPRGCFSETGDPLSSLGAPQGGFRAHILVEGCSFMLSHMFMTRINHKTFCCNLFEVGYLCTTKWLVYPGYHWFPSFDASVDEAYTLPSCNHATTPSWCHSAHIKRAMLQTEFSQSF